MRKISNNPEDYKTWDDWMSRRGWDDISTIIDDARVIWKEWGKVRVKGGKK